MHLKLLVFPSKHLVFPSWGSSVTVQSVFHPFLRRYDEMLTRRSICCSKCSCNLSESDGGNDLPVMMEHSYYSGRQLHTCNGCLSYYCDQCKEHDGRKCLTYCYTCERDYCSHCQTMKQCNICRSDYCVECTEVKRCFYCRVDVCDDSDCRFDGRCHGDCGASSDDIIICEDCAGDNLLWCESQWPECDVKYCRPCSESNVNGIRRCCKLHYDSLCGRCCLEKCTGEMIDLLANIDDSDRMDRDDRLCKGSYEHAFAVLLTKNDELIEENKVMKDEIDVLRNEINELKCKGEGLNDVGQK